MHAGAARFVDNSAAANTLRASSNKVLFGKGGMAEEEDMRGELDFR
jgi:hypothetical protein